MNPSKKNQKSLKVRTCTKRILDSLSATYGKPIAEIVDAGAKHLLERAVNGLSLESMSIERVEELLEQNAPREKCPPTKNDDATMLRKVAESKDRHGRPQP